MNLTAMETVAKSHFLTLVTEGQAIPIDTVGTTSFDFGKPNWFDQEKFEMGREYFMQNRFGILTTNMAGLIILLSIPKGLAVINATNRSNNPETARRRYAETIVHTLSWYEVQLNNDTKSWESLKKVRRLHLYASNLANKRKLGFISQMEVSMTTFGFAGFVINRPHLFGIKHDNDRHREGFLHFWAVMNYMLGVEDRFNICLLPLPAVEIEFDIIMRNVLGPFLQIETKLFKQMVGALVTGLRSFIPTLDYDTQMFLTRRAAGIPGYQYDVNLDKEKPYRNIFSEEEFKNLKKANPIFSENVLVFNVEKTKDKKSNPNECYSQLENEIKYDDNVDLDYSAMTRENLIKMADLPCNSKVTVEEIKKDQEYVKHLNSAKFNELTSGAKFNVNLNLRILKSLEYRVGNYILDSLLDLNLAFIRRGSRQKK